MADSYTSIWCTCTENSTNVANNTSNITVNLICSTSGYADDNPNYWLAVNGSTVRSGTRNFSSGQTFTLATWTGDVPHNSDGTGSVTYQGYFQGTAKPNPGNTTQLYTKTLTTLARESKFGSVSDFNFESSFSFPITKNITDATDTLVISSGTFSKTITPYVSDQSITLTSTEKTQLYNLNTTGTTVPLTLTLTTVYNDSTIGSDTKEVNGTFVAEAPTASGTINTSPSIIYEGVTTLRVRLNSITFSLKKAATVVQYSVSVDGRTVTGTSTSSTTYYDFPNLTSGSKTVTVQVLDSRGMSLATPLTKSVTVTAYNRPTITNFSISRSPTPVSTDAKVSISGTYADGVTNQNSLYVQILYKVKGTSTWNSFNDGDSTTPGYGNMAINDYESDEYTFANGQFTLTCDSSVYPDYYERPYPMTSAYDFMICVWDTVIGSTNYISATASLGTASTTLDIDTNTQRVGVGLFCSTEDDKSLSVAGDIYEGGTKLGDKYAGYEVISQTPSATDYSAFFNLIYPVGSIYLSMNSTNPSTLFGGTWVQIAEGQTLWSAGTNYAAGTSLEAGLPNITGTINHIYGELTSADNYTGAFYNANTTFKPGFSTVWQTSGVGLDASRSNPIYGNSDTVQPPAFVVYMWRRTA